MSLPLVEACRKNKLNKIKQLISDGVDPNIPGKNNPVFIATKKNYYFIVKTLLSVNPILSGPNYLNPLTEAVKRNHVRIVELLLECPQVNLDGLHNLKVACRNGYNRVTKLLLSAGAAVGKAFY